MDRLLLPLRSNADWFATEEAQASLERRMKAAAIVHDELIFQDGRYLLNLWEDGVMDWLIPPGAIPGERSEIRYREPGGSTQMMVRASDASEDEEWLPIFRGKTLESLEVDFYPILEKAGLLSEDFVQLAFYQVSEEGKKRFQKAAQEDRRDAELMSSLDVERFHQKPILEAVHFDSALAAYVKSPFLTDQRIGGFIREKGGRIVRADWKLDLRPSILDVTWDSCCLISPN